MVYLKFKESADMACKLVDACTSVYPHPDIRPFVMDAFKEVAESIGSSNMAADTQTDNFNDGFRVLSEAVRISDAWKQFWFDFIHNGRPSRWLRITEDLALHGKAEAVLRLAKRGDWLRRNGDDHVREIWELRQRKGGKEREWKETSFSLLVRSGRYIDSLEEKSEQLDKSFYTFVFPGLEVLGYKTPVLRL